MRGGGNGRLARLAATVRGAVVKPWPGLVDVEAMPDEPQAAEADQSASSAEADQSASSAEADQSGGDAS